MALLFLNLGARWGGWSTPRLGRFTPEKTRYPLYMRLGRPRGRSGLVRKSSPPPELDPRTIQPVASRYADWALPTHIITRRAPKIMFHIPRKPHIWMASKAGKSLYRGAQFNYWSHFCINSLFKISKSSQN